jgi:hypothetical protein
MLDCPLLIAPTVFAHIYLPLSLDCPFSITLQFSLTIIYVENCRGNQEWTI